MLSSSPQRPQKEASQLDPFRLWVGDSAGPSTSTIRAFAAGFSLVRTRRLSCNGGNSETNACFDLLSDRGAPFLGSASHQDQDTCPRDDGDQRGAGEAKQERR
jgi:hypothetical protein